jgi:hypothetical protein
VAGGLSPNQLRAELDEYGSLEAVAVVLAMTAATTAAMSAFFMDVTPSSAWFSPGRPAAHASLMPRDYNSLPVMPRGAGTSRTPRPLAAEPAPFEPTRRRVGSLVAVSVRCAA